jgi:hypothetical protein
MDSGFYDRSQSMGNADLWTIVLAERSPGCNNHPHALSVGLVALCLALVQTHPALLDRLTGKQSRLYEWLARYCLRNVQMLQRTLPKLVGQPFRALAT